MNPHHLNGERLLQQGRARDAVDAFRKALADDPGVGHTHALLALALVETGDPDGAWAASREAARLEPDEAFSHYVLGVAALVNHRDDIAEQATNEALQIEPNVPEYHRLLAMVYTERRRWAEALEAVDRGLALDPEHTSCLNLRSQILVQLNRTSEARGVAEAALASRPDDAHSHANAGWSALHQNKTREALQHFKESLRLDPGNDWAKAGLAEALKARNPLYRLLLGFMLWMIRLDPRVRIGVIIGGYVLYRIGDSFADNNPDLAPFIWPVLIAYIVFAWMTWVGVPMADLTLRLSPYGRHALNDRQRLVSNVLGLFILGALVASGLYLATQLAYYGVVALQIALLALITVGVLQLHRAPRYNLLLTCCGVLGLVMVGNWIAVLMNNSELANLTDRGFFFGFIGMMWFTALGGAGTPRSSYS